MGKGEATGGNFGQVLCLGTWEVWVCPLVMSCGWPLVSHSASPNQPSPILVLSPCSATEDRQRGQLFAREGPRAAASDKRHRGGQVGGSKTAGQNPAKEAGVQSRLCWGTGASQRSKTMAETPASSSWQITALPTHSRTVTWLPLVFTKP